MPYNERYEKSARACYFRNIYKCRALKSSMKKIQIKKNMLILKDDEILDFFEKEVTPHGTGAKIPCSSKYIGKKAYVAIKRD